jgi:hypothetical protein
MARGGLEPPHDGVRVGDVQGVPQSCGAFSVPGFTEVGSELLSSGHDRYTSPFDSNPRADRARFVVRENQSHNSGGVVVLGLRMIVSPAWAT